MTRMKGLYLHLPSHRQYFMAHLDDPAPTPERHHQPLIETRHLRSDGIDHGYNVMYVLFEGADGQTWRTQVPLDHELYRSLLIMVAQQFGLKTAAAACDRLYGGAAIDAVNADRWTTAARESFVATATVEP